MNAFFKWLADLFKNIFGGGSNSGIPTYTLKDILNMPVENWEWYQSPELKKLYDNLFNSTFRWLIKKDNKDELRSYLLEFINKSNPWLSTDGVLVRFIPLVCFCFGIAKEVLMQQERDLFLARAKTAADTYRQRNDTTKQAHTKPFYIFLGLNSWADEMINITDSPSGLEPGSSHYTNIGIFNLLLADHWKGNNNQDAYRSTATCLLSRLTPTTRAGWGREYYGLNEASRENYASTFLYSTLVLLMKLIENPILKRQIKWVVNRHIWFLRKNNKNLWLFTPLMVYAKWDDIGIEEPTLGSSAFEDRAVAGSSVAPEVYLKSYFKNTIFQKQIVALRSGWGEKSLTCLINLAPFNNKGDRGFSGEIPAISYGNNPIINGYLTYYVTNPSQVSVADNGPKYNAILSGFNDNEITTWVRVTGENWSRDFTLDKSKRTITIKDNGSSNTYWHFVINSDYKQVDSNTIITGGLEIKFSSPIVSIKQQYIGFCGFFFPEEISVILSGSGEKVTTFKVK